MANHITTLWDVHGANLEGHSVMRMAFGFGFSSMRACAILTLIFIVSTPAFADGKITISYSISYLGVTVGSADWQLSLVADHYDIEASAQIKGLMSALVDGQGSGHARGILSNGGVIPGEFEAHVVTSDEADTIRMTLHNGAVRQLVALPPFPPTPERVPLTAALLQGVIDPLSASVIPNDKLDANVADQCRRVLPLFDGRRRYDVGLSFKEMREVSIPGDAAEPILVCKLMLTPLAGQQVKSPILHYLVKGQEIEVSLKPIAEAQILVPVGAAIPMLVGTLHVDPKHVSIEMSGPASGASSATRR
jgi:hypothetical protein